MRYCNNNFNDILRSFVLLFELTVVNQWHVLASGYVLTSSKWARLYFVFFHITVVIVLMNIFVAFVLEVFILRYSLNLSGKHTTAVEKKISDMGFNLDRNAYETLILIHLQGREQRSMKRQKSKRDDVDALVETMEENESEQQNVESTLRFRLSKSGAKNVEVLLQQLFEHELEDDEDETVGPDITDLEEMPQQDVIPSPLRLDNIT
ncbi:two pore calcium channel protein 1-like isoform X1 [Ptychodera flava]|uniref:two pore calcium channel protein 1-like isoform X1 n=1 Tax=Ptychodera flava TaxID=63121 RepID=UPI003969C1F4